MSLCISIELENLLRNVASRPAKASEPKEAKQPNLSPRDVRRGNEQCGSIVSAGER